MKIFKWFKLIDTPIYENFLCYVNNIKRSNNWKNKRNRLMHDLAEYKKRADLENKCKNSAEESAELARQMFARDWRLKKY